MGAVTAGSAVQCLIIGFASGGVEVGAVTLGSTMRWNLIQPHCHSKNHDLSMAAILCSALPIFRLCCAGTIPKLPANLLLVKNLTAHGIYWWVLLPPKSSW